MFWIAASLKAVKRRRLRQAKETRAVFGGWEKGIAFEGPQRIEAVSTFRDPVYAWTH